MVYGTLKSGYHNNYLLGGARLVGKAVTLKAYQLFDCGFPMAVPSDEKAFPVLGEIYEVSDDAFRRCDSLEGHPDWYIRRIIEAKLVDNEEIVQTYIYEMPRISNHRTQLCDVKDNTYYMWSR